MPEDGKSTIVDRPASDDERRREPTEPPRRPTRRSIPPGVRYDVGAEIGRGGMGRVVEATDTLLDRRVAVKEALTTDPELLRRFARETKITARLEHPSIVPLYDAGFADGQPYYVMRRVSGRPLSELIRAATSLDARLALVPHVLAAAQAIAHAHQRGIIHRDIKPSNILVGELGETVVIDWGLAKVIGEPDEGGPIEDEPDANTSLRTKLGAVFGTPGFMAPDQVRGELAGPQSDVYSLGASLYNLLAAEPPHYASDSTQMMKLAAMGPPVPIADRVPGVPAELSTIVDAAMAYDPEERYPDAGAFAEELKRFLAGQLVASHRYSRTERFLRFLRRNRAGVAIGGAALVIVVVVGAFAVSQVIEERDRADRQARLATVGRHEAEAARAMADERADQLMIARARALLDSNPTAALASLEQLSLTSPRLDEARAIVNAARIRGVGWAMQASNTQTATATLDQTGLRLAQMTTDGVLHVYDLDARRLVFEQDVGRGAQPRWILDGKQLLVAGPTATRRFEASGREIPAALPPLVDVETDERGRMMIATDPARRALRIDLETGTTAVLAEQIGEIAIARDGGYAAVAAPTQLIVFDAANRQIVTRPHDRTITRIALAPRRIAIIQEGVIYEAPLAPGATWKRYARRDVVNTAPYWIEYNNDQLYAAYTDARVVVATPTELREIGRLEATTGGMVPFGHDYLAVGGDGRRVYYVDGAQLRELQLPIALRYVRIVGRRAHPRVVAIGDGAITVIELERPRLLPVERYQATYFMGEQTLLASSSHAYDFAWFDLPSLRSAPITTDGAGKLRSFDRARGRMLLVEMSSEGRWASVYRVGEGTAHERITAPFDDVQLAGEDGLLYAKGSKLYGGFRGASRPELLTTNGAIQILVQLPGTRYAAVAEHEIVRGDLRTGDVERIPLEDGPPVSYAVGSNGDLVISRGNLIYRWTDKLVELARLEARADYIHPTEHGLVATLENHSTVLVGADGKTTRLASSRGGVLVSGKRVLVPGQSQYDVIELPSLARWPLPLARSIESAGTHLDLSPNGSQLLEKRPDGRLWLWKLPAVEDFKTSLEATNLTEDVNGVLLWPWQSADPKR